jgi:hypothetical protein
LANLRVRGLWSVRCASAGASSALGAVLWGSRQCGREEQKQ